MNLYSCFLHVSEKSGKIALLSLFLNENFDSHIILSFHDRKKETQVVHVSVCGDMTKQKNMKMFSVLKLIKTTKIGNLFT